MRRRMSGIDMRSEGNSPPSLSAFGPSRNSSFFSSLLHKHR